MRVLRSFASGVAPPACVIAIRLIAIRLIAIRLIAIRLIAIRLIAIRVLGVPMSVTDGRGESGGPDRPRTTSGEKASRRRQASKQASKHERETQASKQARQRRPSQRMTVWSKENQGGVCRARKPVPGGGSFVSESATEELINKRKTKEVRELLEEVMPCFERVREAAKEAALIRACGGKARGLSVPKRVVKLAEHAVRLGHPSSSPMAADWDSVARSLANAVLVSDAVASSQAEVLEKLEGETLALLDKVSRVLAASEECVESLEGREEQKKAARLAAAKVKSDESAMVAVVLGNMAQPLRYRSATMSAPKCEIREDDDEVVFCDRVRGGEVFGATRGKGEPYTDVIEGVVYAVKTLTPMAIFVLWLICMQ